MITTRLIGRLSTCSRLLSQLCTKGWALAMVTATAIVASSAELGQGLVDALVYGLVGVLLQGAALVMLEVLVPGRFRDLIADEKLHPGAVATAVILLAVGGVNAAALS